MCLLISTISLQAQTRTPNRASAKHSNLRLKRAGYVAYDAKDKRWYSVAWAKQHGMKDRGGDPLTLIRKSKLPKDAKMSRAMLKK